MSDTTQFHLAATDGVAAVSREPIVRSAAGATMRGDAFTERTRIIWSSGDFGRIAVGYAAGASDFVNRLSLNSGDTVLDAACGTGNLAIPAARAGATVTGIDIARNLVDEAREAAQAAGLPIRVDEGDVEALPYADHSFTTVMSMFGVMFAPHPQRALAELFRVARPRGKIALANWTPTGFIGSVLRAHTALVPPPAGLPSVLTWGDTDAVTAMLAPHRSRIRAVQLLRREITMGFPVSAGGTVELFREFYGPSVRAYAALGPADRARLTADLVNLWSTHNTAGAHETRVTSEYLDVRIELVGPFKAV
jgi:SAM-dependent methyltransferase